MESVFWDSVFCFLPSLLLLLLSLLLRRPSVHCWICLAARAAAWRLWIIICLILELPLDRNTSNKSTEAGSAGTDSLSGSSQASDGPQLICKPTALAKYLLRHCGSLARPKLASWPRGDPHLQTLSGQLWGKHGNIGEVFKFTREHLLLKDGGVVALDWAVGTGPAERRSWEGKKENQPGGKMLGCFTAMPPILLLIPQYHGGMTPHLEALCYQAVRQGFYVVVFHPRGTAGCPLTTTRLTEFGDPADLEQAVAYVHGRHPSSALVAVSEGSGSGVLLSYLGESGSSCHLTAAAAISPVLLGQQWFETAMPLVYRCGILFQRKMTLSRYATSFRGLLDVDRALSCSLLRDFEETLFCSSAQPQTESSPQISSGHSSGSLPLRGLSPSAAWALGERVYPPKDWDRYWERNEPLREADEVAVPLLCICSRDDPILPPASSLPIQLFQNNPYFLLALTDRGGHCGFTLERHRSRKEDVEGENWSHVAVLEFFRVVADFLKREDRDLGIVMSPVDYNPPVQWSRNSNVLQSRRRRTTTVRRQRLQMTEESRLEAEEENFTWKRSYTR